MNRSRTLLMRLLWHQQNRMKLIDCARPAVNSLFFRPLNIREQSTVAIEDGYVKKFMKAIGWMDKFRTRLKLSGYFLYEGVPDQVDYVSWFKTCHLEDTFSSWFTITELHVWLLMVRCMAEDVTLGATRKEKYVQGDGHFIRNCIVEALWADVGNRVKLLEGANPSVARKQVSELSEQFQAALVGYDEGLHDDRRLAAAVWRRFYGLAPQASPEDVERIVKFVRQQMSQLDKISGEELRKGPKIAWLSLDVN